MIKDFLNDKEKINQSISIVESVRKNIPRVPHNHINVIFQLREFMSENCKNYLEIGVYHGGSMITAMQSKYPCNFFGVDFFGVGPDGIFNKPGNQSVGVLTPESVTQNVSKNNIHNHNFELFQMDSQLEETSMFLKEKIKDGVDILMIDGCHEPHCIINDFNLYSPLVNKDGFICFDDYLFAGHIKETIDSLDLSEYEIIGCIDSSNNNDYLNESSNPSKNSSFIIRKK